MPDETGRLATKSSFREWRCECSCSVLGVSFYAPFEDDPSEWFIEIYKLPGIGAWRWRIKNAVNMLLGREVYIECVSLDRQKATEFVEWMATQVREIGAEPVFIRGPRYHIDSNADVL